MWHDRGVGITNQITSLLKEVSFGFYYFQMGLLFRNALLLNGILFNTEVIHGLTDKHIDMLEECDKMLMQNLFESGAATPIETFYMETSTLPVKFVLMGRQLMYYHTLLRKSESELVKRVFIAQREFPSRNDWLSTTQKYLSLCDINMSGEEVAKCSEYKFKKLVDEKIKQKAAEYLTKLQMKHSKSKYLYEEEKIKEYLISDELSTNEKKWLFKMRVRMCPNKTNFEGMYKPDLSCSLCLDKTQKETELHLLNCDYFQQYPELSAEMRNIEYDDIFKDLARQTRAVRVWMKIFKIYNKEKEKRKN